MDYFILSRQIMRIDGANKERINICGQCAAEIRRIANEGRKSERPAP